MSTIIEVIIDYGSAFVTYGKITETKSRQKGSSFPAKVPLIILKGEADLQSPVVAQKFLPYCHRNTRLECVLTNATTKMNFEKPVIKLVFENYNSLCQALG